MVLPNALEKIGLFAFCETSLENVKLPASLREVSQGAFANCARLRSAEFDDGLEVLGTNEYLNNGDPPCGVFESSALESIRLPATLKRIEFSAFESCERLKSVTLPDKLEYIGKRCFCRSGLGSIRLPPALKAVESSTFS